jgi:hypothetical protein
MTYFIQIIKFAFLLFEINGQINFLVNLFDIEAPEGSAAGANAQNADVLIFFGQEKEVKIFKESTHSN